MSAALRAYCPYGYHQNQASPASMLGFNGERYDPFTYGYALGQGYRCYSPTLMRFQGPDDLSPFLEGGFNTYIYCKGDPVNYQDDSGRAPTPAQLNAAINKLKPVSSARAEQQIFTKTNRGHEQPAARAIKMKQKAKSVSFAGDTIFERNRSAHYREYQERKKLINEMNRLHTFNELLNNDLNQLWSPVTRSTYRAYNLLSAYRRRLESINHSLREVQLEKEAIQLRLQQIRR
ncbi:RHS repeat-associated core domain-containing protein [Pseudomonas sp. SGAir0191]|uniref:RHS repeat-associated core domain-containing protein n=1 Tax=Pseudomonas sp. SGAir0191 TaxID=2217867 RepID=UPI00215A4B44|nr:RHS repeat-associated core domain-containing protein [Pseudomonas sp. SGAir0191]